ncbi:MAG: DNA repair protein RadC [Acidimicrobiia bacterium]|nr:DNA repair protein RadC [Acidimicrobiia bacterium]
MAPTAIPRALTAPEGKSPHAGHRRRLRDRFLKGGSGAFADYELLELVLCLAHPRGDTKPLAKRLIARFGSFAAVLAAESERVREVEGAALAVVRAAAEWLAREEAMVKPVLSSWQALTDYLRVSMARETREQFRVLFLNRKNMLIADEVQGQGTIDHTPLYPREVVKRALEHGAAALILVHNHPSGDPMPSKADIAMTREVKDACAKLGIVLHDHLIE